MTTTDKFIFTFLQVIAWIIFVALSIKAGAMLTNFIVSLIEPGFVKNLYLKLDLSSLRRESDWMFYGVYSFLLFIALAKAHLFYIVVMLVSKFDITKPFNAYVSEQISRISHYTFSIGLISMIAANTTKQVEKYGFNASALQDYWSDGQAYILMAAVIYIISRIFRKGIELQNENDLTI